ncbi:Ti-type conjugative transfer relaxase TraA [Sphingomonas qomolangmaensis]|uniref:Ti-type conjugative transfer relaxase TraA n=1 Tax=Sphingomonas qomolangmaensis TaxID=2918765 RepID=A0ABY5L9Y9_9SPHN|nr:Ti-type conjugative transfer relaxase TraA [Sphingomonas qomolangmaensis]UUL83780.1 Ti-type conjugative transfer relaxase TraA [Sphingomonas qomolangmaensis]
MAIYHFSAKVISRAAGSSAVASAAYRSASRLHDQRLDRHHDFSNKAGVVHSEVLLPDDALEHLRDRAALWNEVEAAEKRVDAQLAREVEFAIPRELNQVEGIRLARNFVQREFVSRGMVADLNVHWDIGADGEPKPHAHVMLATRSVDEYGFGAKNRDWNRTDLLKHWREAWAEHANARLAELDIDARIDHRTLEAQGIDLEPQHKIGPAAARMAQQGLESERLVEHHAIARANGDKLIANPGLALDAITRTQATFTHRDLAMFVHRHSDGKEQFDAALAAVRASPDMVALGKDGRGNERFTSRDMLDTEQRLERATEHLHASRRHGVGEQQRNAALARAEMRGLVLSREQRSAFEHVTKPHAISTVVGYAGTGKSAMLGVARDAWENAGYAVRGAALSGVAAENLEAGSGIASRTIASLEHQWGQGRELLTTRDVLVIDEAGMIGTRQMERVMAEVQKRGAKVVLVGDPEQLQAIEAGAAFRSVSERHGGVEITEIRRQREDWQRNATRHLATERTGEAIAAYEERGHVHVAATRDAARVDLIERWDSERVASPAASRIILTHTNEDVQGLNEAARQRLRIAGQLGQDVGIATGRGARTFASGDRLMFLKNERSMGVKNGSLGVVQSVSATSMAVLLDNGRAVAFDIKDYHDIDHGYAATIHKAQGVTVDRVHVLATPGLDRHAAYVALSRHRDAVDLHYGRDDFADHGRLVATLSRERSKDMASDYAPTLAAQRQIVLPAPAGDQQQAPKRDMFAGLKLRLPPELAEAPLPPPDPANALSQAVKRHAGIVREIRHAHSIGTPYTAEQRQALTASRTALDALRPHAQSDLETALAKDLGLIAEAAEGRTSTTIRAMQLETELRVATENRADRFVQRWQTLERQRRLLLRDYETAFANEVGHRMIGMAKSLERDPQVESILRNRRTQLGLPEADGRSIGQSLADMIGRGRSRGLDIGM